MRIAIFFMVLLTLSAAIIATVSIASNVSLPVRANVMQTALFDGFPSDAQPCGDPVDGGGKGPT